MITLAVIGTSCVRYRPDGRLLVSTHWDYTVRIYDQKRLKPLAILRHHRDSVYAVDFAEEDAHSSVYNSTAGDEIAPGTETNVIANGEVEEGVYSADVKSKQFSRSVFATASKDCTIAVWDVFADSYQQDKN